MERFLHFLATLNRIPLTELLNRFLDLTKRRFRAQLEFAEDIGHDHGVAPQSKTDEDHMERGDACPAP